MTLEQQRDAIVRRRGVAMPIAGAIAWTLIGIFCFLVHSPTLQVWAIFIGAGSTLSFGIFISRFTGEDFLAKGKPKNTFDTLFYMTVAMALMVYAIAIPFFEVDYSSLPLTVGILTGLMWLPLSWIIMHWVGIFHAVTRTVLVLAAWYFFPHERFVAIPAVIVVIYLASIAILEQRFRALNSTH